MGSEESDCEFPQLRRSYCSLTKRSQSELRDEEKKDGEEQKNKKRNNTKRGSNKYGSSVSTGLGCSLVSRIVNLWILRSKLMKSFARGLCNKSPRVIPAVIAVVRNSVEEREVRGEEVDDGDNDDNNNEEEEEEEK